MDICASASTSTQDLNDSGSVQDTSSENVYKGQAQLLDLSDDVLLCILKYCSPRDLKALGFTCPRLGALVCDHTLWQTVDGGKIPIGQQRFKWYLTHCLTNATKEIKLTGYADSNGRCLGVHDPSEPLHSSIANSPGRPANSHGGYNMDEILFRMWFPMRPSDTVSPRWLSTEERDQPLKLKAGASGEDADDTGPIINGGPSGVCSCKGHLKGDDDEDLDPHSETKRVVCPGPQFTLTAKLLRDLKRTCTQLTSLFLEYCNIDNKYTNIGQFPSTLRKLSLRGTRCYNQPDRKSYLCKIMDYLPNLEYLDVSECDWFEPESLMPLSKVPCLKELRVCRCPRLTECVAYASLATRYGFRQLRILDIRGTPLADSEVSAFGWLPLLEELYMSPPEDRETPPEHAHSWHEKLPPFKELEPWETQEPDYYKVKVDESEDEGFDDELAEDTRDIDMRPRQEQVCRRRIIVVQPNGNHEMVMQQAYVPPMLPRRRRMTSQPDDLAPKRPTIPDPENQEAGPSQRQVIPEPTQDRPRIEVSGDQPVNYVRITRRNDANGEYVKFTRSDLGLSRANDRPKSTSQNSDGVKPSDEAGPSSGPVSQSSNADVNSGVENRDSPEKNNETDNSDGSTTDQKMDEDNPQDKSEHSDRNKDSNSEKDIEESEKSSPDQDKPQNTERPTGHKRVRDDSEQSDGPSGLKKAKNSSENGGSSSDSKANNNSPENEPSGSGTSSRDLPNRTQNNSNQAPDGYVKITRNGPLPDIVSLCRSNRLNRAESQNPPGNLANRSRLSPAQPYEEPRRALLEPFQPRREVGFQELLDIHLERPIIVEGARRVRLPTNYAHHSRRHNLITDSSILRFGRGHNEHVVHIGVNVPAGVEAGNRPDRSNLRVLSVTGFVGITDRSLTHLATAAPFLRRLNFSETSVTAREVDNFKALRPDCQVVFSKFTER